MDKSPLQSSRRPYSPCYKAPEWISHRVFPFLRSFVRVVSDSIEYTYIFSIMTGLSVSKVAKVHTDTASVMSVHSPRDIRHL